MSIFSERLSQILDTSPEHDYKFAKAAGVTQSQVSRWRTGESVPRAESLASLLRYVNPTERAELLSAYLLNEIPKEFRSNVLRFQPINGSMREEPPRSPREWPEGISDELAKKLYVLAELARDTPEITAIVEEFYALAMRSRNPRAYYEEIGKRVVAQNQQQSQ